MAKMEERETTKQKTETKKQKRARSGFWTWVVASVAFRLALVYLPRNLRLSTRPDVATPLTSIRLRYWLKQSVMSPYAGSMCHGSPLLLLVLRLLPIKRNSYVGNIPVFDEIREKLQEGHNVVLISNHQTEADPAVIALLLEGTHSHIAENVTYVAGDRVVTDPLCKPFSMGRNLVCVYSKKHMFDVLELVEMKRRSNTRSLKEMALLLRGGSQLLWIAPSGGRDHPDPLTGEWYPAPFDSAVVDNMRRLAEHSAVPGHLYPLALLCYDIMPLLGKSLMMF